jgi:CHAT domain-containing protein
VGKLFPAKPEVVRGRRAHRARILQVIATADVFHFMGHAWCDWHEPLDSGLLCSSRSDESGSLTVRDIFAAGSIKPRLIVLSACEVSNLQAGDKQNDFINLPAALIALGAGCVIAPRWRVNDVAASMLVANVFERWLGGAPLLEALASARQWLRDEVSRSTVEKWLESGQADAPDAERLKLITKNLRERYGADERPFSHVMHWGAFEAMGNPYPFGVHHA